MCVSVALCVCVCACEAHTHTHTADDGDYSEPLCLNKEDRGSLVQIVIEIV